MRFRKKPVVIQAWQNIPANGRELCVMCMHNGWKPLFEQDGSLAEIKIPTLEGEMTARPGDWIIKGVKNEFYPCKNDVFEATYEPA